MFAHFQDAIAANGARSLASPVLARIRGHASRIGGRIVRRANEIRVASCDLTNGCCGTIGRGIDTRTRAVGIAAVAVDQIAIVANFGTFEDIVAANRGRTGAIFANLPRATVRAVGQRTAARMGYIVTRRRDARIEIGAIACGIVRQTRKLAIVAAVAIGDISVFAFFRGAHEEITALIRTANSSNADLTIAAGRAIGRIRPRSARMIVLARLFAITRIGIVAFCIARGRSGVIAREGTVGFATVTVHGISIVTGLGAFHNAIVALRGLTSAAPHSAHPSLGACSCRRNRNRIVASASCNGGRYRKARDRHQGREPTRIRYRSHNYTSTSQRLAPSKPVNFILSGFR